VNDRREKIAQNCFVAISAAINFICTILTGRIGSGTTVEQPAKGSSSVLTGMIAGCTI
jgi:hypothetical protein